MNQHINALNDLWDSRGDIGLSKQEIIDFVNAQTREILEKLEEEVGEENLRFPHSKIAKDTTYGTMGDAFTKGTNDERRRIRTLLSEFKQSL